MINLADTLDKLRVSFAIDFCKIHINTFAITREDARNRDRELAKILQTVGATPETEEQFLTLMQILGREIWQHHVRQMQKIMQDNKVE